MGRKVGNMIIKNNEGITLTKNLTAGSTSLVFEDGYIGVNSKISIYTNKYGYGPSNVVSEAGKITMTFSKLTEDLGVMVEIRN